MGFKSTDLRPTQVTPITPPAKDTYVKIFEVARTDTTAKTVVKLPAQCSILSVKLYSATAASDAATTAIVTINISNNTGVISTGIADVKANVSGSIAMTNLPNIETLPTNGDLTVTATYSETGTASTTGGPWKFVIEFIA